MPCYKIKRMEKFEKAFYKLPPEIKLRFEKQFMRLEEDPYAIGKPLGQRWFRELKNSIYRVYYLIYNEETIVLLADASNKKDQKKVISFTKSRLKLFREYIKSKYYK